MGSDNAPSPAILSDLSRLVRRVDEDRWLASRFAPAMVRERLIALYAVHHEIVRSGEAAKEPGLAAIRLAWWRDSLAQIHAGAPAPPQPALLAYARHARCFAYEDWLDVLEAQADVAFSSWAAVEAHAQCAAGGLMRLALSACGVGAVDYLRPMALAQGLLELCRMEARRPRLPGALEEGLTRAMHAYAQASAASRGFSAAAFPAFGHVTFTPLYDRALRRGRARPALLARQWRLVGAVATGCL